MGWLPARLGEGGADPRLCFECSLGGGGCIWLAVVVRPCICLVKSLLLWARYVIHKSQGSKCVNRYGEVWARFELS